MGAAESAPAEGVTGSAVIDHSSPDASARPGRVSGAGGGDASSSGGAVSSNGDAVFFDAGAGSDAPPPTDGSFLTVDRDLNLLEIDIPDRSRYAVNTLTLFVPQTHERGSYICHLLPHRLAPTLFIQKNAVHHFDTNSVPPTLPYPDANSVTGSASATGAHSTTTTTTAPAAATTNSSTDTVEWSIDDRIVYPLTHVSHPPHSLWMHVTSTDGRIAVPFQLHSAGTSGGVGSCRCAESTALLAAVTGPHSLLLSPSVERVQLIDLWTGSVAIHPSMQLIVSQIPIRTGDRFGPCEYSGPIRFATHMRTIRDCLPPPVFGAAINTPHAPTTGAPATTPLAASFGAFGRASPFHIIAEYLLWTSPFLFVARIAPHSLDAPIVGSTGTPPVSIPTSAGARPTTPTGNNTRPQLSTTPTKPTPNAPPPSAVAAGVGAASSPGTGTTPLAPFYTFDADTFAPIAQWHASVAVPAINPGKCASGSSMHAIDRNGRFLAHSAPGSSVFEPYTLVVSDLRSGGVRDFIVQPSSDDRELRHRQTGFWFSADSQYFYYLTATTGRRTALVEVSTTHWTSTTVLHPDDEPAVTTSTDAAEEKKPFVSPFASTGTTLPAPAWIEANPRVPLSATSDAVDDWVEVVGPGAVKIIDVPLTQFPRVSGAPRGAVFEHTPLTDWEWATADVINTVKRVEAQYFASGNQERVRPSKFPPTLTPRITLMCFDRIAVKAAAPDRRYLVKFGCGVESDWYGLVDAVTVSVVAFHPFWRTLRSGGKGEFQYHIMRSWYLPHAQERTVRDVRGALKERIAQHNAEAVSRAQCMNNRICG